MAGQHGRAETLLEQASRHAAVSRDVHCLAHYHNALGHVLLRGRQFNSAVASYHTAAVLYHLAGDEGRAARNKAQVASVHTLAGRFRLASETYAEVIGRGDLSRKAWATIAGNHAICLLCLGEWDTASELLAKALVDSVSLGLLADQSRAQTLMALIALRRFELERAEDLGRRALEIARLNARIREEIAALECLGEIEYERGNPAGALRY